MLQYASTSGCTSPNIDVKWRVCQIPQSSPVSLKSETNPRASPSRSRATAATGRGTSTGAAAESPAELGARPQRTRTAQRGEPTGGNLLHKISGNPQKKWKSKTDSFHAVFSIFLGVADWLSLSKIVAVYELIGKQQWLERNKRNLTHPWRQTATVEIV